MSERKLITAALPYANGRIHLGHLVEYCQTDMYVRALKRLGEDAIYICANDAHGTPIEVNAKKQGIPPEELVATVAAHQKEDFSKFGVEFDHFGSTHAPSNRELVYTVYKKLREGGHLVDRETEGAFCENDQRFLPDRFVRGTCPKCNSPEQYGDTCEECHSTYATTDLIDAACVLCGKTPVMRASTHVFFRLSDEKHTSFLRHWIDSGVMAPDIANYVRQWIDKGLLDWCISRDTPYFGFEIPDRPGKFFYVWLDAPLGYASSSIEWGASRKLGLEELWQSEATSIEHIIGKDVVYFHTLFWPAILNALGFSLPKKVHVHGMLTINGKKMSKSRGTFINANTFAAHIEPEALRYYYACKYGSSSDDLDLSGDDLVTRINAELVNKHANLFSRAAQFLNTRLEGQLGDLPFSSADALTSTTVECDDPAMLEHAQKIIAACHRVIANYRKREFGQVMRDLAFIADIGNEFMQTRAPWAEIKTDMERARHTITFALNVCEILANFLWPIVPKFAEAGARVLGIDLGPLELDRFFKLRERRIGKMERLFERLDKKAMDAVVEASVLHTPAANQKSTEPSAEKKTAKKSEKERTQGLITFQEFQNVQLKVGEVLSAERVPKSDKLLKLMVHVGENDPRQIVAGIAEHYDAKELPGRTVVVVTNLAPAKIRGVRSEGMLLAANDTSGDKIVLRLVSIDGDPVPGAVVS